MTERKKTYRALMALTLLGLATCGGRIDQFTVNESSESTIEQGTVVEQLAGQFGFSDFVSFDISQTDEFQNQGVTKDQIDSVRMTKLHLEVVDPPSGQDLSFIDTLEFFVEADGLERKRVASGTDFPEGATAVDLMIDDVELKPYAVAPSMDITTEATGHRPANDTTVEGTVELLVDVNIAGAVGCGGS